MPAVDDRGQYNNSPNSGGVSNRLSSEQMRNAKFIISVGRDMGMSARDIRIGLMTAMQESSLKNIQGGDRDSAGLFQQRPSQGWGSYGQVTNPRYATRKFFNALKGVSGRDNMKMWEAAQTVQRSGHPTAYAKWTNLSKGLMDQYGRGGGYFGDGAPKGGGAAPAVTAGPQMDLAAINQQAQADLTKQTQIGSLVDQLTENAEKQKQGGVSPTAIGVEAAGSPMDYDEISIQMPTLDEDLLQQLQGLTEDGGGSSSISIPGMSAAGGGGAGGSSATGDKIVNLSRKFLGDPYVWGGTKPGGFDCSGLTQYVLGKMGIEIPRISAAQGRSGKGVSLKGARPGDLIFWDNSSRNSGADHVAIYIGGGKVLHAPKPGASVRIEKIWDADKAWARRFTKD